MRQAELRDSRPCSFCRLTVHVSLGEIRSDGAQDRLTGSPKWTFNSKQLKADLTPAHFGDVLLPVGVIGLLLVMLIPCRHFIGPFLSFSITLCVADFVGDHACRRPVEFSVFPRCCC